ncbi:MAG: response regulator [Methylotenera sp.]|nr:response regulator [Methylotenera sp.]
MNATPHIKPHILLVDDERVALAIHANGLISQGYTVSTAESVDEAEILLKKEVLPDIVILDVGMPDKSGLILAEQLSIKQIPFILLTAFSDQTTIDQATQYGASAYLVKPIVVKQLIPAIDAALVRAQEVQQLKVTRNQLTNALNGDRNVNIAIGIVMLKHRIDRKAAFNQLRDNARKQRKNIAELAKEVISDIESVT